jgi:dephospho-CoA kinase
MLRIGVTGGIGAGKSIVCQIFESLGIPVFNADEESKKILSNDAGLHEALMEDFGEHIFTGGLPDRRKIAALVFGDEEKLRRLNALLHPRVIARSEEWFRQQHAAYAIKEAALIYEAGTEAGLDYIIVVTAPDPLRIERIKLRDGLKEEEVLARMKRQWPQQKKEALADFVILNNGEQLLIPQVLKLHARFTGSAQRKEANEER